MFGRPSRRQPAWCAFGQARSLSFFAVSDAVTARHRPLGAPAQLCAFEASPLRSTDRGMALRRLMEARMIKAGRREYVQVLRLLETFELEDLHAAVKAALRLGSVGFDAVKHLVLCRVEKRPPKLDLDVYPYLPRATVARTSAASYMCLVAGMRRDRSPRDPARASSQDAEAADLLAGI
jgi:hypothetical protein